MFWGSCMSRLAPPSQGARNCYARAGRTWTRIGCTVYRVRKKTFSARRPARPGLVHCFLRCATFLDVHWQFVFMHSVHVWFSGAHVDRQFEPLRCASRSNFGGLIVGWGCCFRLLAMKSEYNTTRKAFTNEVPSFLVYGAFAAIGFGAHVFSLTYASAFIYKWAFCVCRA